MTISKTTLTVILNQYDKDAYKINKNFNQTDSYIYSSVQNNSQLLTITPKTDSQDNTHYIHVTLTDNNGKILWKDVYQLLFEDTELFLVSRTINKETTYFDKKIAYVGAKTKKSAQTLTDKKKIQKLESQIKQLSEINNLLRKNAEAQFPSSNKYFEIQEKITRLEADKKYSDYVLMEAEARCKQNESNIKMLQEDNKKILEQSGNEAYFAGITQNQHNAKDFVDLQHEVDRLKGQLSAYSI